MPQIDLSQAEVHALLQGGSIAMSRMWHFVNEARSEHDRLQLLQELHEYEEILERLQTECCPRRAIDEMEET